MSTLRLVIPEWQGGNKSAYVFGAKMLQALVPESKTQETVELKVDTLNDEVPLENGVNSQSANLKNVEQAAAVLTKKAPDKVITLGGSCLISQAPFDYLHQKYQEKLGVIWLDTHPDVSRPEDYFNEHAMVLGNLLGDGDKKLAQSVKAPLDPKSILYVGLQEILPYETKHLEELGINYKIQTEKILDIEEIQAWINENNFTKLAIHFDLDVLDPNDFHSLYFNEPNVKEYSAARGKMSFEQVATLLQQLNAKNDIVGLSIAEYLPWDALRLHELFKSLAIFE